MEDAITNGKVPAEDNCNFEDEDLLVELEDTVDDSADQDPGQF